MNPSLQRTTSTEIRKLLESLNEDNYDSVVHQLSQYTEYGIKESILLFESCLHHFKIYEKHLKSLYLEPTVSSLFRTLMGKPHFCKVFSCLVNQTNTIINKEFLDDLSTAMKLSPFEKLGFGLALSNSENNNVRIAGRNFCMVQFKEVCQNLQTPQKLIQHEDFSTVLPVLLKDSSMSEHVLNLWNVNPLYFSRALYAALNLNPENMNSVVDLLQELEILLPVLDLVPIPLGIRMAAVASQKKFTDLEEWLISNLGIYEDMFFKECVRFLKEVEHGIHGHSNRAQKSGGIWNSFKQAVPTFSKVLQEHTAFLSSNQLSKEMECFHMTPAHNSPMIENISDPDSSEFEVDADNIETEANIYFQLMYVHQLSISAMVQMLMRFKRSSEKREQLIFKSMLNSLLQVNKFYNRYSDEQYKLLAVLFGLLISHQVMTDSTLIIALQTILDALHEPANSKIFIFGTRALENFVDRLIEWPEYCHEVLQISQLCDTHSELVSIIEEALGRTSSVHPKSDKVHNTSTHQQSSSIPPPANVQMPDTSFPSTKDRSRLGSQVSSPPQLQHRDGGSHSNDGQKASLTPSSHASPNLSTSRLVSVTTLSGSVSTQKPQSVVRSSTLTALSPEFRPPSRAVTSAGSVSTAKIGTLLSAAQRRETVIQAPPSNTQDKVTFIVNTLSATNVEAKAKEFTEILEEQYYPWFAHYIVMKRVSIEPNLHMLYINFLEKANSKRLMEEIVRETYENCKVVLRSELLQSSTEECLMLKNFGSWLGEITIGRNKVLLWKQIDPKTLLIEAYEKGFMNGIIPFTTKVLEPCKSSPAYQPPNPWTMGILELLAEIHAMPNLTPNLSFSIEILFKNLDLDIKAVPPTSLLKDRVRKIEGNRDFTFKDVGPCKQITQTSAVNQGALPHKAAGPSYRGEDIKMLFQRVLPMVMDTAIKEIVSSIVERSVSIATQTTMALVLKECITESDENYIHRESCSIVVCLAGNLSYVTSKEPLRKKMLIHLKNCLEGLNVASESLEHDIERVIDENLELGCKSIEKTAVEKGLITVKKEVANQISIRRKQRQVSRPATFDPNLHAQGNINALDPRVPAPLSHVSGPSNVANELGVHKQKFLPPSASNHHIECPLTTAFDPNLHAQGNINYFDPRVPAPLSHVSGPSNVANELGVHKQKFLPPSVSDRHIECPLTTAFDSNLHVKDNINALYPRVAAPLSHVSGPSNVANELGVHKQKFLPPSASNRHIECPLTTAFDPNLHALGNINAFDPRVPAPPSHVSWASNVANELGVHKHKFLPPSASNRHIECPNLHAHGNINAFDPRVPAPLLQVSGPSNVANELGVHKQKFLPPSASNRHIECPLTTGAALDEFQILEKKIENLIAKDAEEAEIQSVIAEVPVVILRCINKDEAAFSVAQTVFEGLYEYEANNAHVNTHVSILAAVCDVSKFLENELTSWVLHSDDERKFNKDITVVLIHRELLNLPEYDAHMAKLIGAGKSGAAMEFCISLVRTLEASDPRLLSALQNVVNTLAKVTNRPVARRDEDGPLIYSAPDPPGFHLQVAKLFTDWCRICISPGVSDEIRAHYVSLLDKYLFSKADDIPDRFFNYILDLSVSYYLRGTSQEALVSPYVAIDAYTDLVYSILKFCPVEQGSNKLSLFSKVLMVIVRFIKKDSEKRKESFNASPYFRLFINYFNHLGTVDSDIDEANFQILIAISNSFHALQPVIVPAFSFTWVELITHKDFMPKLFAVKGRKGWPYFKRLLVDLLHFMEPFLRNGQLAEPVRVLYKGTLRVLLVLVHDFPEFICYYHFNFSQVIAFRCVHLRNIILSTFPRNMRLPDPTTPNLKVDLLAEMNQPPCVDPEFVAALKAHKMKNGVDEYLMMRPEGSSFLLGLKHKLLLSSSETQRSGTCYNVPLINSLVLYVGTKGIQQLQASRASHETSITRVASLIFYFAGAALDIFRTLILNLDSEGRYLFFNAVADQMRYPNTHTHFFSFVMLHFFMEIKEEAIQEQMTRVLLERLITHLPHPWGVQVTFIELVKNTRYNFWNLKFIRSNPEIKRLLESVSTTLGFPVQDMAVSGDLR